jgi:hypothetical protein
MRPAAVHSSSYIIAVGRSCSTISLKRSALNYNIAHTAQLEVQYRLSTNIEVQYRLKLHVEDPTATAAHDTRNVRINPTTGNSNNNK